MTREEAKEILTHNWTRVDNPNYSESELDEAFFMAIEALKVDTEGEDMQTKERARVVAKETELAYIEAKLENAEERLQGACVANFIAEQLERLKDMTDEERLKLLHMMFPSVDTKQGGDAKMRNDRTYINEPYMQQSRHEDGIMTKEEAIELLEDLYGAIEDNQGRDYDEAFRMAIKALQADSDCSTCKHKNKGWDSEECDSCCGNNSHYEPVEVVQTDLVQRSDVLEVISDAQDGSGSTYNILQPLFVKVNNLPSCHRCDECDEQFYQQLLEKGMIELPTEYVSVVRCKDCRWWQDDYMGKWCSRLSGVHSTNADDYCSWGERRSNKVEEVNGFKRVGQAWNTSQERWEK